MVYVPGTPVALALKTLSVSSLKGKRFLLVGGSAFMKLMSNPCYVYIYITHIHVYPYGPKVGSRRTLHHKPCIYTYIHRNCPIAPVREPAVTL